MVTGGDDKRVNMWAIGKPHALLVRASRPRLNPRWCSLAPLAQRADGACLRRVAQAAQQHTRASLAGLRRGALAPQSLAGHQSGVECVAFDATEEAVVAGAAGGTLKMFDIAAAKGARAHAAAVRCRVRRG